MSNPTEGYDQHELHHEEAHPVDLLWSTYPDVPGAFWPCATGGDDSRAWVERGDDEAAFPDLYPVSFEDDYEAAWAVAQASGWPLRFAVVEGGLSPYVQPFAHDRHDPED